MVCPHHGLVALNKELFSTALYPWYGQKGEDSGPGKGMGVTLLLR